MDFTCQDCNESFISKRDDAIRCKFCYRTYRKKTKSELKNNGLPELNLDDEGDEFVTNIYNSITISPIQNSLKLIRKKYNQ